MDNTLDRILDTLAAIFKAIVIISVALAPFILIASIFIFFGEAAPILLSLIFVFITASIVLLVSIFDVFGRGVEYFTQSSISAMVGISLSILVTSILELEFSRINPLAISNSAEWYLLAVIVPLCVGLVAGLVLVTVRYINGHSSLLLSSFIFITVLIIVNGIFNEFQTLSNDQFYKSFFASFAVGFLIIAGFALKRSDEGRANLAMALHRLGLSKFLGFEIWESIDLDVIKNSSKEGLVAAIKDMRKRIKKLEEEKGYIFPDQKDQ